MELAHREDDEQREVNGVAEAVHGAAGQVGPQNRLPGDEAQPGGDSHRYSLAGPGLREPPGADERRRCQERGRVEDEGEGGGEELDEKPAQPRPGHPGEGVAAAQKPDCPSSAARRGPARARRWPRRRRTAPPRRRSAPRRSRAGPCSVRPGRRRRGHWRAGARGPSLRTPGRGGAAWRGRPSGRRGCPGRASAAWTRWRGSRPQPSSRGPPAPRRAAGRSA